jgi:hypothetical protein
MEKAKRRQMEICSGCRHTRAGTAGGGEGIKNKE